MNVISTKSSEKRLLPSLLELNLLHGYVPLLLKVLVMVFIFMVESYASLNTDAKQRLSTPF